MFIDLNYFSCERCGPRASLFFFKSTFWYNHILRKFIDFKLDSQVSDLAHGPLFLRLYKHHLSQTIIKNLMFYVITFLGHPRYFGRLQWVLLWVDVRRRASCDKRRPSCDVRRALITSSSQELPEQSLPTLVYSICRIRTQDIIILMYFLKILLLYSIIIQHIDCYCIKGIIMLLCHCWFLFILWWGCRYANMSPSDKKSVQSLILRWPLRPVSYFFQLLFTTCFRDLGSQRGPTVFGPTGHTKPGPRSAVSSHWWTLLLCR